MWFAACHLAHSLAASARCLPPYLAHEDVRVCCLMCHVFVQVTCSLATACTDVTMRQLVAYSSTCTGTVGQKGGNSVGAAAVFGTLHAHSIKGAQQDDTCSYAWHMEEPCGLSYMPCVGTVNLQLRNQPGYEAHSSVLHVVTPGQRGASARHLLLRMVHGSPYPVPVGSPHMPWVGSCATPFDAKHATACSYICT